MPTDPPPVDVGQRWRRKSDGRIVSIETTPLCPQSINAHITYKGTRRSQKLLVDFRREFEFVRDAEPDEQRWEYGFYDSDPEGTQRYELGGVEEPQENPFIFWYVFGLPHLTAESAEHTSRKSTWGRPVIVRRRHGSNEWEHLPQTLPQTQPVNAGAE